MKKLFLIILCLAWTFPSIASVPLNYTATYRVYYNGIRLGKSTRVLKVYKNGRYRLSNNSKATFPLVSMKLDEVSSGVIIRNRVRPTQYNYYYKIYGNKTTRALKFIWPKKRVWDMKHKKFWPWPLRPATQDNLSYQLQMRLGLSKGKKRFTFMLADRGKFRKMVFRVLGKQMLTTPMGKLIALEIQTGSLKHHRGTIIWVSPKYGYILIRMDQYENGHRKAQVKISTIRLN